MSAQNKTGADTIHTATTICTTYSRQTNTNYYWTSRAYMAFRHR